jgi:hypothetical protein
MNTSYYDGDFTVPVQNGLPEFKYHNANRPQLGKLIIRNYLVKAVNYVDPILNAPDPQYPAYRLCTRTDPQPANIAGLLTYKDTFSSVPAVEISWGNEDISQVKILNYTQGYFITSPGYDRSKIPNGAKSAEVRIPGGGYTTTLGGDLNSFNPFEGWFTPDAWGETQGQTIYVSNDSLGTKVAVVWWFNIGDTFTLRSPKTAGTKLLRECFLVGSGGSYTSEEFIPILVFGQAYTSGYTVLRSSQLEQYIGNIWRRTTTLVKTADIQTSGLII